MNTQNQPSLREIFASPEDHKLRIALLAIPVSTLLAFELVLMDYYLAPIFTFLLS